MEFATRKLDFYLTLQKIFSASAVAKAMADGKTQGCEGAKVVNDFGSHLGVVFSEGFFGRAF
jgi:hypothetical protein